MSEATLTIESEDSPKEVDAEVEFTYTIDYITGACNALMAIHDIDTMIMNKRDELRIKRIKRKSLRILDECITEYYNELFEDEED